MKQKFKKMNLFSLKKLKYQKFKITGFTLILLAGFSQLGRSQEVYDLSRCVITGLENNFSLKIAKTQEQISDNNYTLGNAGYLPTITTTNRFGGTMNNTHQTLSDDSKTSTGSLHNNSGSANVNLDLTLFKGFQVQTTYQKLNELKAIGDLNTLMNMENVVSKIIAEYYLFIQQLNLSKNLAYAVELSRERVRIDEQRYLLGSSSKLELLQSMVYLNADSSQYAKQTEILLASQVRLKKLMALENLEENITLQDSVIQIDTTLIYNDLLRLTLEQNTGLLLAAKDQNISELDYKIITGRAYPYLNLSSGYTYSFNRYEAGNFKNQQVNGMNYGLTLGMDLYDGYERKREKQNARVAIETQKLQFQEIEQEVKADLITIYYAYENNLRLLKLEEQNLEVARENLGIALERYKLGNLSGLDLREVQKSLLDAEERLISVQYLTKLAEISLLQISGQIMNSVN
ncbi:MAG TPA: TolC family protein [Prolixibacteraceae bacterium]|nr:TolC family protein [Prolixibacteraceae bacterium]